MKKAAIFRGMLACLLVLLLAAPTAVQAQGSGGQKPYTQAQLDQMLAPVALYPDSLLAQVLVAASYPLEVVQAARWLKQNQNLKGEQLNAALDKMTWDLSIKALVPFPQVLSMMNEKLDWTQNLGDAFVAQQSDVMDSVQRLRAKAQAQGNLKSSKEQNVVVKDQTIIIEPVSPTVVYVPSYNPVVVYGAWPYPAYPPYPYYPYGAVATAGIFGFAAGVAVGAAWSSGWGHWDWGHHDINVNVNRNVNINRNNIPPPHNQPYHPDANHRQGVPYRDQGSHNQYGQKGPGSPNARNDYRGRTPEGGAGGRGGQPGAGQRPTADSTMKGLQQREAGGGAFGNMSSGREARMNSERGSMSRSSFSGDRGVGGGFGGFEGGGREGFGESGMRGGGFGGFEGGGRGGFGGGDMRGGGGRRR